MIRSSGKRGSFDLDCLLWAAQCGSGGAGKQDSAHGLGAGGARTGVPVGLRRASGVADQRNAKEDGSSTSCESDLTAARANGCPGIDSNLYFSP